MHRQSSHLLLPGRQDPLLTCVCDLTGAILLACKPQHSPEHGEGDVPESMHGGLAYARLGEATDALRKLPASSHVEDEFGTDHPDEQAPAHLLEVTRQQ